MKIIVSQVERAGHQKKAAVWFPDLIRTAKDVDDVHTQENLFLESE